MFEIIDKNYTIICYLILEIITIIIVELTKGNKTALVNMNVYCYALIWRYYECNPVSLSEYLC